MVRDRRYPYEWELRAAKIKCALRVIVYGGLTVAGMVFVVLCILSQNNYNV